MFWNISMTVWNDYYSICCQDVDVFLCSNPMNFSNCRCVVRILIRRTGCGPAVWLHVIAVALGRTSSVAHIKWRGKLSTRAQLQKATIFARRRGPVQSRPNCRATTTRTACNDRARYKISECNSVIHFAPSTSSYFARVVAILYRSPLRLSVAVAAGHHINYNSQLFANACKYARHVSGGLKHVCDPYAPQARVHFMLRQPKTTRTHDDDDVSWRPPLLASG